MTLRSAFAAVLFSVALAASACAAATPATASAALAIPDPRHLANGRIIPSEGYADQPYIVQTDDGAWLCVMTTGTGVEAPPTAATLPSVTMTTPFSIVGPAPVKRVPPTMAMFSRGRPR